MVSISISKLPQFTIPKSVSVDHTMGLIPLLRNALGFPKTQAVHPNSDTPETRQKSHKPKVDLYGPRGTREFIRTLMKVTHTRCGEFYAVHELLAQGETNSVPIGRSGFATNKVEDIDSDQEGSEEMSDSDQLGPENILHLNELPGSDIYADSDGFWRNFTQSKSIRGGKITVDAGSIIHRGVYISQLFKYRFRG